jgi:hypothetical protein
MRGGNAMGLDLAQGKQFLEMNPGMRSQSGGAYTPLGGAPVVGGDQGLLDGSLRASAMLTGPDASIAAARGMSDQAGGRRSRGRNNSARRSRKNNARRSRSRNNARRSRNNARRSRNNVSRRSRNNARRSRNNVSRRSRNARRSRNNARRSRNNARRSRSRNNARRSRNNARRSRRRNSLMYGGAASYAGAPYAQPSMLLDGTAAAKAGTADFSDPFAKGSA